MLTSLFSIEEDTATVHPPAQGGASIASEGEN